MTHDLIDIGSPEHTLSTALDRTIPNPARVYDALLGGDLTFAADRRFADEMERACPGIRDVMRWHKTFLRRAVTHAANSGVRQFLDIGSGFIGACSVHDIGRRHIPDVRCVYADHDPVAVAQIHDATIGSPHTVVQADFCDPAALLRDVRTTGVLNFAEPIALLVLGVLHHVNAEHDVTHDLSRYREAVAPGSLLIMSQLTGDQQTARSVRDVEQLRQRCGQIPTPACFRTRAHFARLFSGFDIEEPGVVWATQWHADSELEPPPDDHSASLNLVAVGRKPLGQLRQC